MRPWGRTPHLLPNMALGALYGNGVHVASADEGVLTLLTRNII